MWTCRSMKYLLTERVLKGSHLSFRQPLRTFVWASWRYKDVEWESEKVWKGVGYKKRVRERERGRDDEEMNGGWEEGVPVVVRRGWHQMPVTFVYLSNNIINCECECAFGVSCVLNVWLHLVELVLQQQQQQQQHKQQQQQQPMQVVALVQWY